MNKYEFLQENDLFTAYKKTKCELFNDKASIASVNMLVFESDLDQEIKKLFKKLQKYGLKKIQCSDYWEVPKSLKLSEEENLDIHFFSTSLEHNKKATKIEKLQFRKVINCGIDLHIISALWVNKIGHYIDAAFGKNIYGSRLTRIQPINPSSCEFDGEIKAYNIESPRIFQPYQYLYQNWRNKSFDTIKELHKTTSVITITMDISSFFHSIKLNDFTTPEFYKEFNLDSIFSEDETLKIFHEDFVALLAKWNENVNMDTGVPVGLSASPILANAVMKNFDEEVEHYLSPAYYGRYVDDILLVLSDPGNVACGNDVIDWLVSKKIPSLVDDGDGLLFRNRSQELRFKKSKQKIFFLDKKADLSLLEAMEAEIHAVSSEWRFLPDIACDNSTLLRKVIGFYSDGKEFNDALRKIDAITMKRLGLSLLLSHAHALNEYISPSEWKNKRIEIYKLLNNHIFVPKNFFDNYLFVHRIFRLMIHSGDGEEALCFLKEVQNTFDQLKNNSESDSERESSLESEMNWEKFGAFHQTMFQEIFIESFSVDNKMSKKYAQKIIDELFLDGTFLNDLIMDYLEVKKIKIDSENEDEESDFIIADDIDIEKKKSPIEIMEEFNQDLFFHDLSFDGYASISTRAMLIGNKKSLFEKLSKNRKLFIQELSSSNPVLDNFIEKVAESKSILKLDLFPLVFPTRMFSPLDVSIVYPFENTKEYLENFYDFIDALRGTHSKDDQKKENFDKEIIDVPYSLLKQTALKKIGITNYQVDDNEWYDAVKNKHDKSLSRYCKLEQIVNEAVKKKPHYLVLPELSIPRDWAWLISRKLIVNGISLITGVEYLHNTIKGNKFVRNSLMMFLTTDEYGYKSARMFRQDKVEGAHRESIEIRNIVGASLKADRKFEKKYIYNHGDFHFAGLICNELTDVSHRQFFKGKIDNLFIVEWNQDIKSFNSLVEASALDIHCYISQVNNRKYGDSRIRAPYKEDYEKDVVRIFGGNHDYLVVGEIDIKKLREFQSYKISPTSPFKPVPAGFILHSSREKWGTGSFECREEDEEEN
ncbi:MAG: RNA-directed DNA polymerase [Sulfuricurvum sp.]|nr:RNA-directed DNA polymerase [Sulfuricurvum sp.]